MTDPIRELSFAAGVFGAFVMGAAFAGELRDDPGFRPRLLLGLLGAVVVAIGALLEAAQ